MTALRFAVPFLLLPSLNHRGRARTVKAELLEVVHAMFTNTIIPDKNGFTALNRVARLVGLNIK